MVSEVNCILSLMQMKSLRNEAKMVIVFVEKEFLVASYM